MTIIINDGLHVLRAFAALEKSRREQQVEELRKRVQQTPVSEEVLNRLSQLHPDDFAEVIGCHRGFKAQSQIESLRAGLENFRISCRDLQSRIADFSAYHPQRRTRTAELRREQIVAAVRKEIFATSTSAIALDGYSSVIKKLLTDEVYELRRKEIFDEGQERFIRALRNCLSHELFVQPDWRVTYKGVQKQSAFEFRTANLLRISRKFTQEARSYIERAGSTIDVATLFQDYAARVNRFYEWADFEIESRIPTEVEDYRRCLQLQKACAFRLSYGLFLNIWIQRKADPYNYLRDYLDDSELEEVNRLPQKSKAQVDRIIQLLDTRGACDEELRALVYRLFQVES